MLKKHAVEMEVRAYRAGLKKLEQLSNIARLRVEELDKNLKAPRWDAPWKLK